MNEVLTQKIISLQRCVARAREAHAQAGSRFQADQNLQDAAVLNVIRACDTAIDLANMVIRAQRLGIPAATRESFLILGREELIDPTLAQQLAKMVGFRNLAVHQYQELDLDLVESVIRLGLDDLLTFAEAVRGMAPGGRPS